MRRSQFYLLFIVLFSLVLTGCGGMLTKEVRSVTPHLEQRTQADDPIAGPANLTELKNDLIDLVRQHSETGRIRVANYTGNINTDMSRAFQDILREDPICAYTVNYFTHDYSPLTAEVSFSIIYLPNRDWDIPRVSLSGLTDEIMKALTEGRDELVLEVGYYESGADLNALLREAYFRVPARAVGMPTLSFNLFPDSGLSRVVDMKLSYPYTPEETRQRILQANQALDALLDNLPDSLDPPTRALRLYDLLGERVSHTASPTQESEWLDASDNLYTALVDGHAASAGFALSYKLLCDQSGLECRIVTGLRGNTNHVWNLVKLDDDWYHVDAAADAAAGGTHDWFLKTDTDMQTVALWTRATTPQCTATRHTYETLTNPPGENTPSADGTADGE